jgi:hypothetical protein
MEYRLGITLLVDSKPSIIKWRDAGRNGQPFLRRPCRRPRFPQDDDGLDQFERGLVGWRREQALRPPLEAPQDTNVSNQLRAGGGRANLAHHQRAALHVVTLPVKRHVPAEDGAPSEVRTERRRPAGLRPGTQGGPAALG